MARRALAFLAGFALGFVLVWSVAEASTTVVSANPVYQRWANEARVPTPPGEVEIVIGDGCGGLGCTEGSVIELSPVAAGMRDVFYHELGHPFDLRVLTDGDRERFMQITRSYPTWWNAIYTLSAGELFASVYAQCARLTRIDPRYPYTVFGGALRGRRIARSCELIRRGAAAL